MSNFWQTGAPRILKIRWFPLSILIFDQKFCFLGPTILKIPKPNWYYCICTCQGHSPYEAIPPPTILACLTNLLPQISLWFALGLNTSKSCCLSFRSMSVEALEPSSEVAELPNKPLKKTKIIITGLPI